MCLDPAEIDDIEFALEHGPERKKMKLTNMIERLKKYATSIKEQVSRECNNVKVFYITSNMWLFLVVNS